MTAEQRQKEEIRAWITKQRAPKSATAQARGEAQKLLEKLQPKWQLDAFALKCLKAADANTTLQVLQTPSEQNVNRVRNSSAYLVHLLKKEGCDICKAAASHGRETGPASAADRQPSPTVQLPAADQQSSDSPTDPRQAESVQEDSMPANSWSALFKGRPRDSVVASGREAPSSSEAQPSLTDPGPSLVDPQDEAELESFLDTLLRPLADEADVDSSDPAGEQGPEGVMPPVLCPITQAVIREPVVVSDGSTYERSAIEEWASRYTFSPMTGAELTKLDGKVLIIPNHTFKALAAQLIDSAALKQ
ncbi:hypothetical protein WJX73_008824 [Symbiochloris irregularis]|uniref:U-box domain-containing protein n=1 Tax=Symbiochloris irregularis TaxID=706552 RepID=A0AAW1P7Z7_9CHLO